ncbi:MAG: DUF4344 domain-containing metallopeptidase [Geminicoccaceae bacterium]
MSWPSRYAWSWFLLPLWLLSAFPYSADASDGLDVEAFDDTALFVVGNTLFTVYHELGHALIDMLNLPVIGREEDAVDGLAAVTMIPEAPDELRDALVIAVADGWRAQSEFGGNGRDRRTFWGEHALDEQRHFAIVCLMVGSDQEGFYDFALEAGLPDERIETCSHDFTSMKNGWKRLLDPHRPAAGAVGLPSEPPITLTFEKPLPEHQAVFDLIREDGLLEEAVLRFGEDIVLPSPITIRFSVCDDANAYWSPRRREVTVCYALVAEFETILLGMFTR